MGTKCCQTAGTGIIGARTTKADHDPSGPVADGRQDQLSQPGTGGASGVATIVRNQMQPTGLGTLNVGSESRLVINQQNRSGDRLTQRTTDRNIDEVTAQSCVHHCNKPGPAIGQGCAVNRIRG